MGTKTKLRKTRSEQVHRTRTYHRGHETQHGKAPNPKGSAIHIKSGEDSVVSTQIKKSDASLSTINSLEPRSSVFSRLLIEAKESFLKATDDNDSGEEETDILQDIWDVEDFEPSKEWEYGHGLSSSFCAVAFMGYLFLRLPMTWYRRADNSVGYKLKLCSKMAFLCGLKMFLLIGILVAVIVNFVMLLFDFPKRKFRNGVSGMDVRREEIIVLKRYCVPLLVFLANVVSLTVNSVMTFVKREYLCRYFSYWTQVVELIRVDATKKLKKDILFHIIIAFVFTALHFALFCSHIFSYMDGGAAAISILLFRGCSNSIIREVYFKYTKWFTAFLASYCYGAQKFYMIWLLYRCRLLRNMFSIWNKRFQTCLLGSQKEKNKLARHTRVCLYQDHIATLNIIDGANYEFSTFMEAAFVCTYFCVTWNCYHAIRSGAGSEFDQPRRLDFFPAFVFMMYDACLFFRVCYEAAEVPEMVRKSYDLVRKKGILSNKADQELWFVMSLKVSFVGCVEGPENGITGGDYIFITKPFLLVAFSQMLSFCIMLFQFDFHLDQTPSSDPLCDRVNGHEVVNLVENLYNVLNYSHRRLAGCDRANMSQLA